MKAALVFALLAPSLPACAGSSVRPPTIWHPMDPSSSPRRRRRRPSLQSSTKDAPTQFRSHRGMGEGGA
jgi:hypothetical protein